MKCLNSLSNKFSMINFVICNININNDNNLSTVQRAQLYYAKCPALLCNVLSPTVQRAQSY